MDYVLKDKRTIFIDKKVKIGKNVIIYENNRIEGQSVIEDNVTIFPNCFITNSKICKGAKVYSSIIDRSVIGRCSALGPYSVFRRCDVGDFVKVGAFCELKNAKIAGGECVCSGTIIQKSEFVENVNAGQI